MYKKTYNPCDECKYSFSKLNEINEMCKICEFKDYIQAEEQGLLVRLPCKVGDKVYKVWYKPCHLGNEYPDSYDCCGCEDECDLTKTIFEFRVPNIEWILRHLKEFGDCVWFLTREEAEQALAEKGSILDD